MGKHSNKDAFIVKVLTFFKLLWTIVVVDLTGTFLSLDGRHSNIGYAMKISFVKSWEQFMFIVSLGIFLNIRFYFNDLIEL